LGRIVAMAIALAVVLVLVLVDAARAGTYRVAQCGWGIGAEVDPTESVRGAGFYVSAALCTSQDLAPALRFEAAPTGTAAAGLARARWISPPSTTITKLEATWSAGLTPGFERVVGVDDGSGYRRLQAVAGDVASQWIVRDIGGTATAAEIRLECGVESTADCPRTSLSWLLVRDVTLTVRDNVAPATWFGGPLADPGWHAGTLPLEVGAADAGAGVKRVDATVDGIPAVTIESACAAVVVAGEWRAARMQPCPPAASRGIDIDTAQLGEGRHLLHACAVDFAGNAGCAPDLPIGVDNLSPAVAFVAGAEGGVTATASDAASGPASGSISLRRADADGWSDLSTDLVRSGTAKATLTAHLPKLESGTYAFRAVVTDGAGNVGTDLLRVSGSAAEIRRQVAAANGEVGGDGSGGPGPPNGRQTTVTAYLQVGRDEGRADAGRGADLTVSAAAEAAVRGRLTGRGGAGLAGRRLEVVTLAAPGARGRHRAVRPVVTHKGGRFAMRLPTGPSRRVVVSFAGGGGLAPSRGRSLALRVAAAVSLAETPRRLRTGQSMALRGRVSPGAGRIPARGKVVAIQYLERASGDWRPALVVRSDARGRFKVRYRFRYITGEARIRLRATALPEAGWPYASGSSAPVTVEVHG
jgi:hypothetical protein